MNIYIHKYIYLYGGKAKKTLVLPFEELRQMPQGSNHYKAEGEAQKSDEEKRN
jgi:hypothetical protein